MAQPFSCARPIWIPGEIVANTYASFFARFPAVPVAPCALRVAADSHYAVYLNDEYVYSAQYADDEDERVYDEIDIAPYVRAGENALRIEGYCALTDCSVYRRGAPYVIFEVFSGESCLAYSGPDTLCARDARYVCGETDWITPQMGYTFSFDATVSPLPLVPARLARDIPAMISRPIAQCVMGARKSARVVSQGVYRECEGAKTLGQRMQGAYMAYREVSALGAFKDGARFASAEGDGLYAVLDLGEEETGLLDVELTAPRGTEVLIGWGEHLDDLRVRAYVGTRNFCARFVAGGGRFRFFHPFRRLGARYLQLHIASQEVTLHYAGLRPVAYPVPEGAGVTLADALHARVYEVCRRTLLLCMHEHYEDCPWREQALYAMDSRNQMLAGYYVFGEYAFPRASLRLLLRSLRPDGLLELCAPARVRVNIPSFSLMFVVQLWEYLLYSGDEEFAREALPVARIIVDTALARARENGLLPRYAGQGMWNFYEWSPALNGHLEKGPDEDENRFDAPLNAFAALASSRLALLYRALQREDDARTFECAAEALRQNTHRAFFDGATGMYASYMQGNLRWGADELTQALCVYSGVCPQAHIPAACARLTDGSMTPVTLAYSIFKYEALLMRAEGYGEWVARDICRQWGTMLSRGATSFWETILGGDDFDRAGSLCHGWSAVPAYLYFAYGAGVQPVSPGWTQIETRPVPGMPAVTEAILRMPDGCLRAVAPL